MIRELFFQVETAVVNVLLKSKDPKGVNSAKEASGIP